MKRNFILIALLIGVTYLFAALNPVQAVRHADNADQAKAPVKMAYCQNACVQCADVCETTLKYCLKESGAHKESAHIKALQDCIATCKMSADFMKRGSDLTQSVCQLCADACKRCAESCDSFKDDKQMKACAEECRKCEKSCESMKG